VNVLLLPLEPPGSLAAPPVAGTPAKPRPERQKERGVDRPPQPVGRPAPEGEAPLRSSSISIGPASSPVEPPASHLADARTYVAPESLSSAPRLTGGFTAFYPRLAYRQGRKGVVVLQLMIDERGTVTEALPLAGTSPDFVDAAIEALRRARFQPAEGPEGRPVRARAYFAVSFVLE